MMKMLRYRKRGKIPIGALLILVFLVAGLYSVLMSVQFRLLEFVLHTAWAEQIAEIREITLPHFGMHAFVILIKSVSSYSWQDSLVFVMVLSWMGTALMLWSYLRGTLRYLPEWALIFFTMSILLFAPMSIVTYWIEPNFYNGFAHSTPYHNPTFIAVKPWNLLIVLLTLRVLQTAPEQQISKRLIFLTALVSLVGTLTKPNFTIVLLPALSLVFAYRWYKQAQLHIRWLIGGVFLPSVLVLIWQFLFTYNTLDSATEPSSIVFRPLEVLWSFSDSMAIKNDFGIFLNLLLSLTFPLVVLMYKSVREDMSVRLAWILFAIGYGQMLLLAETGERAGHANFFWGGHMALFILYVFSIASFLKVPNQFSRDSLRTARLWICMGVFGLHWVTGIFWLYQNMILPGGDINVWYW